jgi:hypothetical protein
MTATDTELSMPLRTIYFDSPAQAVAGLTAAVRAGAGEQLNGVLSAIPAAARGAVLTQVAGAAAGLLELRLADVFELAWGKYAALRSAAEQTMADRDSEQLVGLATHQVSFTHQPSVQVQVADLPAAELTLRLEVEFLIRGALAVVRAGRLTAIRSGRCDVTGTLAIAGHRVLQRHINVDLPLALRLGNGVALLDRSAA